MLQQSCRQSPLDALDVLNFFLTGTYSPCQKEKTQTYTTT